jgi:hypothetical protein
MAGLGAYGGSELGGSLAGMGAEQAQGLQTAETAAASDLAGKQAYDRTLSTATADQAKKQLPNQQKWQRLHGVKL